MSKLAEIKAAWEEYEGLSDAPFALNRTLENMSLKLRAIHIDLSKCIPDLLAIAEAAQGLGSPMTGDGQSEQCCLFCGEEIYLSSGEHANDCSWLMLQDALAKLEGE